MAAGDAAAVARCRYVDEIERLAGSQLGEQDARRLHAEAAFQQRRRIYRPVALARFGRVVQVDVVRVIRKEQFGNVFDGDDPVRARNLLHQGLHERRLAGAGFTGHDNDFFLLNGALEKAHVVVLVAKLDKLRLDGRQLLAGRPDVLEEPLRLVVGQGPHRERRFANRHRNRPVLACGRHNELDAFASRQHRGKDRRGLGNVAVAEASNGNRKSVH